MTDATVVPILDVTAGLEGRWEFAPAARTDGLSLLAVRFARADGGAFVVHYGAVFIFPLLDGLVARGEIAAAYDAGRAAVRALELKHAARRLGEAAKEFPSVEGIGRRPSTEPAQPGNTPVGVVTPAGAGLPDLPPAGEPSRGAGP